MTVSYSKSSMPTLRGRAYGYSRKSYLLNLAWSLGSLLVDYMLTVAVISVASGADICSSSPSPNLHISIFLVCLLMLLNLRSLKENLPVHWWFLSISFIISTVFLLLYGIFQLVTRFSQLSRQLHLLGMLYRACHRSHSKSFASGCLSLIASERVKVFQMPFTFKA